LTFSASGYGVKKQKDASTELNILLRMTTNPDRQGVDRVLKELDQEKITEIIKATKNYEEAWNQDSFLKHVENVTMVLQEKLESLRIRDVDEVIERAIVYHNYLCETGVNLDDTDTIENMLNRPLPEDWEERTWQSENGR